jgi:hypothetical protein
MQGTPLKLVNPETNFLWMNIKYSASLGVPFAEENSLSSERGVVICGTAPTLVKAPALREIQRLKKMGYKICAVKQAIRILNEYEIKPDFSVAMDPGEKQIKKTPLDPEVLYYVASSCHPRMFNYLLKGGAQVNIFHSACGAQKDNLGEMELYEQYYPQHAGLKDVAMGGYTVVNRAVALAEYLGAKKIVIAGAPFGWREGDDYYAPTVTEVASNATGPTLDDRKLVDGKLWFTKADLLPSALSLARKAKLAPEKFEFLGDSLAASLTRRSDEFLNRIINSPT